MKLTRIAPLVLVAAILLCTVSCAKRTPKEGRLVVNGTELEETVMFVSDERMEFTVQLLPVLEGYGFSCEYVSDDLTVITKGDCLYHLSLTDLTLYLISSSAYEPDEEIPHINLLRPPVGAKSKEHPIVREGNDVIVDMVTMQGILVSMQEKAFTHFSYEDGFVEYGIREE
ncbi:MAG: hypothetical protein IJD38_08755 [Clostridia bacterium]|nr:hypothetical protein [Clostridia bacterium]